MTDAERLTAPYDNAMPVLVDMGNPEAVEKLVADADVVIRYVLHLISSQNLGVED